MEKYKGDSLSDRRAQLLALGYTREIHLQIMIGAGLPITQLIWSELPKDYNTINYLFNIMLTVNPSTQVLNLAGGFLGMVPRHWARIAGTAIQTTDKLRTAVVRVSRE
jgi:hypothetical protein